MQKLSNSILRESVFQLLDEQQITNNPEDQKPFVALKLTTEGFQCFQEFSSLENVL